MYVCFFFDSSFLFKSLFDLFFDSGAAWTVLDLGYFLCDLANELSPPLLGRSEIFALTSHERPAPEMDEEDPELMEALAGIEYVSEKKDIVEEVARRVAKRLLKAQKAQKALQEALGKNK